MDVNSRNFSEEYCGPLSLMIVSGIPCLAMCCFSLSITTSDVVVRHVVHLYKSTETMDCDQIVARFNREQISCNGFVRATRWLFVTEHRTRTAVLDGLADV